MDDNPVAGDVLKGGEGDILLKSDSLPVEELVDKEEILTPGTPANEMKFEYSCCNINR